LGYSESHFHKISIGRQFDPPILCTEKLVPKIEGQQSGFFFVLKKSPINSVSFLANRDKNA
jgi:hypothetical protein